MEPYNRNRMISSGFLSTKLNEVVLNNLVPFTLYNVTIFTVLHEHERRMLLHTLETGGEEKQMHHHNLNDNF